MTFRSGPLKHIRSDGSRSPNVPGIKLRGDRPRRSIFLVVFCRRWNGWASLSRQEAPAGNMRAACRTGRCYMATAGRRWSPSTRRAHGTSTAAVAEGPAVVVGLAVRVAAGALLLDTVSLRVRRVLVRLVPFVLQLKRQLISKLVVLNKHARHGWQELPIESYVYELCAPPFP